MSNVNSTPNVREKKTNNSEKKGTTRNRNNTTKKKTAANMAKETKVKKIIETPKVVEELNEELLDIKVEEKKKNKIFIKILDIILWVVLIAWMIIVVIDYVKVVNQKEPMFCIKEEEIEYEDGTVNSCTGLGYKVYEYNRESYQAIEFGPFWAKVRNDDSRK